MGQHSGGGVVCARYPALKRVAGLLLVAAAAFMFSILTLCVKVAANDGMLSGNVLVVRSFMTLVINYVVGCAKGLRFRQFLGPVRKVPLLVSLGCLASAGQLLCFYALSVMAISDANV